jgi:hypothetical protein
MFDHLIQTTVPPSGPWLNRAPLNALTVLIILLAVCAETAYSLDTNVHNHNA